MRREGCVAFHSSDGAYLRTQHRRALSDILRGLRVLHTEAAYTVYSDQGPEGNPADDNAVSASHHREDFPEQHRAYHQEKPCPPLDAEENAVDALQDNRHQAPVYVRRQAEVLRHRRVKA